MGWSSETLDSNNPLWLSMLEPRPNIIWTELSHDFLSPEILPEIFSNLCWGGYRCCSSVMSDVEMRGRGCLETKYWVIIMSATPNSRNRPFTHWDRLQTFKTMLSPGTKSGVTTQSSGRRRDNYGLVRSPCYLAAKYFYPLKRTSSGLGSWPVETFKLKKPGQ